MTDSLKIRYTRTDGTLNEVWLHQVGHDDRWVLDLREDRGDGLTNVHQHPIEDDPEVVVG